MQVKVVNQSQNPLPEYKTSGSAGMDIMADLMSSGGLVFDLLPGSRAIIPTGLFMAIPQGYELQIRSRSGMAYKEGVVVINSPGTIDSDYRGEIKIILLNTSKDPVQIKHGDRICQGVFAKYEQAEFNSVQYLDHTDRGSGGFGSTGK